MKMQELPSLSGWEVCVHSSPSAVRKIISFWKIRKREAESFDNEALRIRGHCFASGLWVKSQGVFSPCLGGSIHHSEYSTTTCRLWHRKPQKVSTYLSKNIRINRCLSFYFPPNFFYFLFHPHLPVTRMLHYLFWLLWTTGNTLLLLVNETQVHAVMQKSEIKHSWICWRSQGWSDPSRSSFSQKVILVFCHSTFGF